MNNNNSTYKDSPCGKIPSDWEVKTLGQLFEFKNGINASKASYGVGIKKRLGEICSTFKSGYGITSEKINLIGDYAVYGGNGLRGYTNKYTHEGNYFLIGRQGALCGNIVKVCGKNYISEHAIAVQTDNKNDNSFLAYKLDFQHLNRLSESSAQPGLSVEKLVRLKITLPPLPEQKAIAHVLGLMDSAINTNNQLTAKKELQKKWLMQNLLTGKKRLLNDELGIINYELKQVFFGNFCRVSKGKAISAKDISNGIYPVIAGGQTSPYSHNQFTHENIITVSASGAYAGFVAFHGNKIWASDCSVIEEIENVSNIHYLYYFLKFKQELIYSLQAGGALPLHKSFKQPTKKFNY